MVTKLAKFFVYLKTTSYGHCSSDPTPRTGHCY